MKKIPLSIERIRDIFHKVESLLNTYKAFLLFIVLAILYSFIVIRISILSNAPPSQKDIDNAQKANQAIKISNNTIQRIKSLEGTNQRTQSIFSEARQNPFKE